MAKEFVKNILTSEKMHDSLCLSGLIENHKRFIQNS